MLYVSRVLHVRAAGGRLLPWLGPALRGVVAAHLKESVCAHRAEERRRRWVHCTGCPQMQGCPYGETWEPDPPPDTQVRPGQDEAPRPIVLAPYYPLPEDSEGPIEFPIRLTLLGAAAARHLQMVVEALANAGGVLAGARITEYEYDPENALFESDDDSEHPPGDLPWIGPGGMTYKLLGEEVEEQVSHDLSAAELPCSPEVLPGMVPRLTVNLCTPLFLRIHEQSGKRRAVREPQFAALFRVCLRTLTRLFVTYDRPLPADFAALERAAEGVALVRSGFEPFRQVRRSGRTHQRYGMPGVTGYGTYANVPQALVPWLLWGGRVHVGLHRVTGAGSWRLILD